MRRLAFNGWQTVRFWVWRLLKVELPFWNLYDWPEEPKKGS